MKKKAWASRTEDAHMASRGIASLHSWQQRDIMLLSRALFLSFARINNSSSSSGAGAFAPYNVAKAAMKIWQKSLARFCCACAHE